MIHIEDFLLELAQAGIKVWADGSKLRCKAPKQLLNEKVRAELAEHKAQIINYFKRKKIFAQDIPRLPAKEKLLISLAQHRLWFLFQLEGKNEIYNMPAALKISGKIDEKALKNSLSSLLQRHESLRLTFPVRDGEAEAQLNDMYSPLQIYDFSDLSGKKREQKINDSITAHAGEAFDLNKDHLFRVRLLKIKKEENILLFNMHHIISDGLSLNVLFRDWSSFYNAYVQNPEAPQPELKALPVQYTDYAAWQRKWLQGEVLETQLNYWTEKLAGIPELLDFPTDYPRPAVMKYRGSHVDRLLSKELSINIKQLSRQQQHVTVFMTLFAAYNVLLFRYSRQNDLVVGSPIANRTHPQTEDLIGLFMNTLVLRSQLAEDQNFLELLEQVRQTALEAYNHQDIPFESLVEQLNPSRSLSHSPLFQVLFVLQDVAAEETMQFSDLAISPLQFSSTTAKFDLVLSMEETQEGFLCIWRYNTDLFRPETIDRISEQFSLLLEGITQNPQELITRYPLLTKSEQLLLENWNRTEIAYPEETTLVGLLQEQSEKTPENKALIFEEKQLSYRELNEKVNQTAHYLKELGVGVESLVGICTERSLEMVIGLLAVVKAGGAYVPLDPDYPQDRLQYMLTDSGVTIVLSQRHLSGKLPDSDATVIYLDEEWERIGDYPQENPTSVCRAENAAYMIYTSGSTGMPKGVINTHLGICNRLLWMQDMYQLTDSDNVLQKTPFSFDVSVWEFFWPLITGACLTIAKPGGHRESNYLIKTIKEQGITTLHFVPSMLQVFLQDPTLTECSSLKRVICSGEALPPDLQKRFFTTLPNVELHNLYGPTEAAIDVTYWQCDPKTASNIVPIGRPIANIRIHILDTNLNPTPLGVPGELCIAGRGLARGYHNREDLNRDTFVETEIFGIKERIYRTGDLARWLPEGKLEYLGRLDFQVKLRGFRIELGEIETALCKHEKVSEAVVILYNEEENAQLAAYLTISASTDDITTILTTWLENRMPEYMVPSSFTVLNEIPLSPNGKVDRKALPKPDLARTEFVKPETEVEILIAGIWQRLLKVEAISIYDNFFALGGNSLNGMRFINELNYKTGEVFHIYTLFESPSIARFTAYMMEHYQEFMAERDGNGIVASVSSKQPQKKIDTGDFTRFRSLLPKTGLHHKGYEKKNPPAIFIFAPPRSGTTLMRVLLGGHPRLFAPPEMELLGFNTLKERQTRCVERDSFWLQGTIRALMEINGCDVETATEMMQACEEEGLDIKEFYGRLQHDLGDRILVDKTPFYAVDASILARAEEYFDKPLYIHLLRHPYGMIRSFEKARLEQIISSHPYAHPYETLADSSSSRKLAELIWLQCHQNITEFLQTIPSTRQYAVKFEDILSTPEPNLAGLCEFLDIPFHADMLQPYQDKKERMTDGVYAEGNMLGDIKFHSHKKIDPRVADDWSRTYKNEKDFLGDITWELAEQLGYKRAASTVNIPRIDKDSPLTLSFAQQRLWMLTRFEGQSAAYNIPAALELIGKLNISALKRSLRDLIQHHESLRLCFPTIHGEAAIERKDITTPLNIEDISQKTESEQRERISKWMADHSQASFDLEKGPLFTVHLLKLQEKKHILLFTMHHIISDGWSIGVLMRDWSILYNGSSLPELEIQYTDYAAWQKSWLKGNILQEQLDYWKKKLDNLPELLELPTDYPRPAVMRFYGKNRREILNETILRQVKQLSLQHGVTVFMTMLTVFKIFLSRYSGQRDLVVGSPTANRSHHQTADLIGFFVNSLVLRTHIDQDVTFSELLTQVRQTALDAYKHQDIPFEYLVEQINPARSLSHSPLFQVMFTLQDATEEKLELNDLQVSFPEPEQSTAKYDLSLGVAELEHGFVCNWQYNSDLFHPDTIERMIDHFKVILESVIMHPDQPVLQFPLLTKEEQKKLTDWSVNGTIKEHANDKSVVDLFHEQVRNNPENIAVFTDTQQLSYQQLNDKANQLADYLINSGVTRETPVGICVERSVEMVIGLLGIVKAGGAYVPLDPDYPQSRLQFMLEDSAVKILLSQNQLLDHLPESSIDVICLDSDWDRIAAGSSENPAITSGPEDLAYIIYTSGSTGVPKGVMIEHGSLTNLVHWHNRQFEVTPADKATMLASTAFDASTWELWPYLAMGASLYPVPAKTIVSGGTSLKKWLDEKRITITFLPTPLLENLLAEKWQPETIRTVLTGGDVLHSYLPSGANFKLYNNYGPTENTVVSTSGEVLQEEGVNSSKYPAIGRPIDGTEIFILDRHNNMVPQGVVGEMYIGGCGLARGYLNRPKLTKERFNAIAINTTPRLLYKTGDLVRWLADGNIEYLGRSDHQVKLRGYRIELTEIEQVLINHEAVKEAVLSLQKVDNTSRLIAYITLTTTLADLVETLRSWLKSRLPDYMIPAAFIVLEKLPITANGKIDRKALPAPESTLFQDSSNFIAPQKPLEKQIAAIWQELLQLEKIGLEDNFFDLGGHSLLIIQMQNQLQSQLNKEIEVVTLFQYPTIQSLATHLGADEMKIKTVQRKATPAASTDIAIIGMSGRFPGAGDIETFWDNIRNGVESIQFFSDDEVLANGVDPALLQNPDYVKARGILEGAELFDAEFFGFTPKEAEILDPQHRLFLESAWNSMEHAGYDVSRITVPVGVFGGAGTNTYFLENLLPNRDKLKNIGYYQILLSDREFMASSTAYRLNLKGPALFIHTACSTSLVAIHTACQSLLSGDCAMALAGGVSVAFPQKQGYLYQQGMIASPDGHCRAFDASARGTVGGAGVGVVVLKPLERAVEDGDTIHAVIKGSAINNDGMEKVGFTAPGVDGQAKVITEAMRGLDFESISYLEAHGTGTELGDPIEIRALTQAYRTGTPKNGYCALGSVKTNVGHLDTAAGVTGLIKTVMALQEREIPPSLHYREPNPQIDFANSPFFVNTELKAWISPTPLRAGVSSFGIGGTNAHFILEEAPIHESESSTDWQIICLSAKLEDALTLYRNNLAAHISSHQDQNPAEIAYTLQVGRKTFGYRTFLISDDITGLAVHSDLNDVKQWRHLHTDEAAIPQVVFMFSGQGSQYVHMAADLYATIPFYKAVVDECIQLIKPYIGIDLHDILYPAGEQTTSIQETYLAQATLFIVEYALAKLCYRMGIEPAAMIGHSIGEYVAACLAGVLSLADALQLVAIRGKLMQKQRPGTMLSVQLSKDALEPLMNSELSLAAHNAPDLCVVSGANDAIKIFSRKLTEQKIVFRSLHTSHAFHSPMMEPVIAPFRKHLQTVSLHPPQIPYVSNLTGTWISPEEATSVDYWCEHLLHCVHFSDGVQTLMAQDDYIYLELGPGQSLTTLVRQHQEITAFNSLRPASRKQSDRAFFLEMLGQLWLRNVTLDWSQLYTKKQCRRIPLVTYPFQRKRYWIDAPVKTKSNKLGATDWLYKPAWKPSLLPATNKAPNRHTFLIFKDNCGISGQLLKHLDTQLEAQHTNIITVKSGSSFTKINDHEYALNPGKEADYQHLFQELNNRIPDTIVHLWQLNHHKKTNMEHIDAAHDSGFYSMLFMAQAIGKQNISKPIEIIAVSNNMQSVNGNELLFPEKATILASVKVIGKEYPNLTCRSVDFDYLPTDDSEKIVTQIAGELLNKSSDQIVAYRREQCLVQTFEPVSPVDSVNRMGRLRKNGVYLITGGLGGIGLTLAEYLAKKVQAKLILTGRTPFPASEEWKRWLASHDEQDKISRQIRRLMALEACGAEIFTASVDVADIEKMEDMLIEAENRFDQIDGVIHAAGIADGAIIARRTREMSDAAFAAKIKGTLVLDTLLYNNKRRRQPDFFVLCSSLASVLGIPGQVGYCAANEFMDAYALSKASETNGFISSINWDSWQEVGMAVETGNLPDETLEPVFTPEKVAKTEGKDNFQLTISAPGVLETLTFKPAERKRPKANEVEIEVVTAGLNFKEILYAVGMLDIPEKYSFGLECAGRITRVGKGVTGFTKGDEVIAFAPSSLSTFVTTAATSVFSIPDGLSYAEAATIPIAFSTAYYALISLGRLRSGERILIHAAAGGVGLAAVIISQWLGAEIYATAGNPKKREYLRSLGVQYVMDSRSLDFAEEVMQHSNNLGVDLVLNSLGGEFIAKSMETMAPFGRFLELGIRDILNNAQLDLRPFEKGLSYSYVNAGMQTPYFNKVVEEVMDHLGNGHFTPLPCKLFALSDIIEGFDYMARGQHIGKVVISFQDGQKRRSKPATVLQANRNINTQEQGVLPADGAAIFEYILTTDLPQVVVSTTELTSRFKQRYDTDTIDLSDISTQKNTPEYSRPQLSRDFISPRNKTEEKLVEIWQQLLGINPIGVEDDFFELGGHSLLAVQLMSLIREHFDQHLSPAVLFQGATIGELALVIYSHNTPTSSLVSIQTQGSLPPLFCLPGAGGNVMYLHKLSAQLGRKQPFYGLQTPGIDGKETAPDTIAELASHHINELQQIQSRGPYFIAGHSFGGKVAFEIVSQLEQQGEKVELLTIFDSPAPVSEPLEAKELGEIDILWIFTEIFTELSEAESNLSKETLQSQDTLEQSYELVMQHVKQQGVLFAPMAQSDQLKSLVQTYKANAKAIANYCPQTVIKAPILHVLAGEQSGEYSFDIEDSGWDRYTSSETMQISTPGTHISMFNEPHVTNLAKILSSYLLGMKKGSDN